MTETFDGWEKDYEELEKEENPFRLVFKIFKILFRLAWGAFRFIMIQLRNLILWLLKKKRKQEKKVVLYPVYPHQAN